MDTVERSVAWAFLALLLARAAIAQPPAAPSPNGNGSPPRMPGSEAPPAIPGYTPNSRPRDFTGVWRNQPLSMPATFQIAPPAAFDLTLAALAARKARVDLLERMKGTTIATPHVMCRPAGLDSAIIVLTPIYILQNEREMVFIITDEIRDVRHVYLNQRHPVHITPSYSGDSIGHWEGNTLVVDTVGYNGRGELGYAQPRAGKLDGTTYSDAMHFVQRFTKSADGKALTIESTLDDPKTLKHLVTTTRKWLWVYGQQPLEFDCEENPSEDNFADMAFPDAYLRPVCIRYEGKGAALSKVVCNEGSPLNR